jgi:drug/metabolite transporter (DMT)-like permease
MREAVPEQAITIKVVFLLLFTYALWGGNTVTIKLSLQGFTPLMVVALRSIISCVLLAGWGWAHSLSFRASGRELYYLLIYSLVSGLALFAFIVGVKFTSASRASVFINSYPLFTALIAHYFLAGHKLTWQKVAGSLVAFTGLVVAFIGRGNGRGFVTGDLIITVAAICLAMRLVVAKKMIVNVPATKFLLWSQMVPIPFALAASLLLEEQPIGAWSYLAFLGLMYQGIILGFFCFLVQASLLKYYSANTMASFTFLIPIYGVFYSIMLLGDPLTVTLVIGTAMVASGIFAINYSFRGRMRPIPPAVS